MHRVIDNMQHRGVMCDRMVTTEVIEMSLNFKACNENNIEEVKKCLKRGLDINDIVDYRGLGGPSSALTIAASNNTAELLDLLLSQPGIDVNRGLVTPILAVMKKGNHTIIRRLLHYPHYHCTVSCLEDEISRGMRTCAHADLTIKDATGDTPMTWALRNNKRKLMEQLAEIMETRLRFTIETKHT